MSEPNLETLEPGSESATRQTLLADNIQVSYGERLILSAFSLSFEQGKITTLVGPNGCGKSTLLKAVARLMKTGTGAIYLDGQAIARLPTAEVARRLAILPQTPGVIPGITVGELVEQGRYPHVGALRMLRHQDHRAIRRALELTEMERFVNRPLDQLSGGERQRAWIALALAQATPILLLDEPTTFLDIGHQLEVMKLVQKLNREMGLTVILVLHDLNQAARFSHRLVALQGGQIKADGKPAEVLTVRLLEEVFRVKAHILIDAHTDTPVCLPYEPL